MARPSLQATDIIFAQKTLLLFPGLSSAARTIGAVILDHFNKRTGQCDPGLGRIERMTGLARRTVINAIKELEVESVHLFVKVRHGGKMHRNTYYPNWEAFRAFVAAWDERMKLGEASETDAKTARKTKTQQCRKLHLEQCRKLHLDSAENCTQTLLINSSNLNSKEENEKNEGQEAGNIEAKPSPIPQAEAPKGLGRKEGGQGQRSLLLPFSFNRGVSSAVAAREQAHRRLNDHFYRIGGAVFVRWCEIAAPGELAYEQAVDAETRQRGAGVRIMKDHVFQSELGRHAHAV